MYLDIGHSLWIDLSHYGHALRCVWVLAAGLGNVEPIAHKPRHRVRAGLGNPDLADLTGVKVLVEGGPLP